MGERIEWVVDNARFAELRDPWDDLARGPDEPFLRHFWFEAWWDAFGGGRELRICALWRGDQLAAVLPLWCRSARRLEAMANPESPVFRPLARDDRALAAVSSEAFDRSSQLEMWGVPAAGSTLSVLMAAAQGVHRIPSPDEGPVQPMTDTLGEFSDYRERMKRGWREIERRRRKLLREHDVEFRTLETGAQPARDFDRGLELEAQGWKGERRTAILSSRSTERFYRSVARDLAERGEFSPSSLWVDGRMAAFDLAFIHDARYYLLKTTYDERLRTFAPGLILRLSVIERCFDRGLEAHEFLGLDVPWKRLFSTGEREQCILRVYGLRPLPLLRYLVRRGAPAAVRSAYRRLHEWPDERARRRSR